MSGLAKNPMLIDFTKPIENFKMVTDSNSRKLGKSHGTLSYKDSISDKNTYFFADLNPQPNGAAFVSAIIPLKLQLTSQQNLCLRVKGLQAKSAVFQFLLATKSSLKNQYSYQHKFSIDSNIQEIRLPINDFQAYYRGQAYNSAPILDPATIQAVGIRIIGRDQNANGENQQGLYGLILYSLKICD